MRTLTSTSSTLSCRSSSATLRATSSSFSDTDGLQDLLGVDLFHVLPCFVARDLALGGIPLWNGQVRGDAQLVGDRADPGDEILDPLPGRQNRSAVEVDEIL